MEVNMLDFLSGLVSTYLLKRGNDKSISSQMKANRENIEMQKEFAQHGIRWRVNDAVEAGLHPLAALGANTVSFSPSSVGADSTSAYAGMGQGITNAMRGISKIFSKEEREKLRGLQLQNDILELERDNLKKTATVKVGPLGLPGTNLIDGQNDSSIYQDQPVPTSSQIGVQKGFIPMEQMGGTSDGFYRLIPSQMIMDLVSEGMNPTSVEWYWRFIKNGAQASYYERFPKAKGAKEFRDKLRALRDKFEKVDGYEWQFKSPDKWKLVKKEKNSYFYYDHSGHKRLIKN